MEKEISETGSSPIRDYNPPNNNVETTAVTASSEATLDGASNQTMNSNLSAGPVQNSDNEQHKMVSSGTTTKKVKRLPPYAWQLLPKEELESIAYNSRKQRKARLLENPPICSNCPNVRLTSMAMLATHLTSKKHLARAKKQSEESAKLLHSGADPQSTQSSTVSNQLPLSGTSQETSQELSQETSREISLKANNASVPMDQGQDGTTKDSCDNILSVPSNSTPAHGNANDSTENPISSKRRRRKAERMYKKAKKSRINKEQSDTDAKFCQPPTQKDSSNVHKDTTTVASCSSSIPESVPVNPNLKCSEAPKKKKRSRARRKPKANILENSSDLSTLTDKQLIERKGKAPINQEALASSSTGTLEISEPSGTRSDSFQYCTVCESSWKQERAWKNHLLSAQHARRVVKLMQKIAPVIPPYGMKDVLASQDPFGWGTGAGVVENEEEFDEEDDKNEIAQVVSSTGCEGEGETENSRPVGESCSDDDMNLGE